eukprot:scaffold95772_cov66-Phaeocystis_antarctica.AAC.1
MRRRTQRRGGDERLGRRVALALLLRGHLGHLSQQEARVSIRAACRHLGLLGWVPWPPGLGCGLGWHDKPSGHGQGREGRRQVGG